MRRRVVLFVGEEGQRHPVFCRDDVTVERVETRADALAAVSDLSVDVIVSCQALSDGSGVELCRTVRETHPDLPFLLVTEHSGPELAREAVSVGVDEFLPTETLASGEEVAAEVADLLAVDETQRRYRVLVEQTTDVITVLDPDGTVQYVSPSIEETLGAEGQRTTIDIATLARNLLTQFRDRYPGVEFETDIPQQTWVEAIPLIDTAIENPIENSIEHTDDP